jgi:hypothetical protein
MDDTPKTIAFLDQIVYNSYNNIGEIKFVSSL